MMTASNPIDCDLSDNELDDYTSLEQQHFNQSTGFNGNKSSSGSSSSAAAANNNNFLMDKNKKLFPQKLWELIHNPSIQHCLRWSEDGQRVYLNRNEFEAYYLKTASNQFHTQKAISFVRQMNMYGFRKVDDCYYENDNFRRDQQHLLRNMIRRHPNKSLFVGLDHHQLAAAAAAQQALQVNQHLQQLEQQHKQRAEQALRLSNYLNGNHSFHQAAALSAAHHHHHQQQHQQQQQQQQQQHQHQHRTTGHSSPFDTMSSQLAAARLAAQHQISLNQLANELSSQQQQQSHLSVGNANALAHSFGAQSSGSLGGQDNNNSNSNNNNNQQNHLSAASKKSRLLGDFYASIASNHKLNSIAFNRNHNNNNNHNHNQNIKSSLIEARRSENHQDSIDDSSSADSSQCSSVIQSNSAGSPRPRSRSPDANETNSRTLTRASQNHQSQQQQQQSQQQQLQAESPSAMRASMLASAQLYQHQHSLQQQQQHQQQQNQQRQQHQQQQAALQDVVDSLIGSQNPTASAAERQALHDTLVRSLLQFKQRQQQQHSQQQDFLANIQHQTSINQKSLFESLASLSSVGTGSIVDHSSESSLTERTGSPSSPSITHEDDENIALDLAKSSMTSVKLESQTHENDNNSAASIEGHVDSPLDAAKKVKRFLDEHELEHEHEQESHNEDEASNVTEEDESKRKRHKMVQESLSSQETRLTKVDLGTRSLSKSLVIELCERRGDRLDVEALQEAARCVEHFLETLVEGAASIARAKIRSSSDSSSSDDTEEETESGQKEVGSNIIDQASLASALKLLPSKLVSMV